MPALRLYKTFPKIFRNASGPSRKVKETHRQETKSSVSSLHRPLEPLSRWLTIQEETPGQRQSQSTNMSTILNSLFMTLPLELRQRVYDFYLEDIIANTSPLTNDTWKVHRPAVSSGYFQPIVWSYSWTHDTAYINFGPRITSEGRGLSVLPLLQTELGYEATSYFLSAKLVVEMEVVDDFQRWVTQHLQEGQALHINIRFMADCRFDASSVRPNPFYRSSEPILLLRIEDEGKSLKVRCKFRLKKETVKKWQDALAVHLVVVKKPAKKVFDGRDILQLLVLLQDERANVFTSCECELDEDDLRAVGHVGFPIENGDLRAIFDKKQEYRHTVCSASLA